MASILRSGLDDGLALLENSFLERASEEPIVVLDDYHQAGPSPGLDLCLERLSGSLGGHVHWMIAVRQTLELDSVRKMHARGMVLDIGHPTLAFTANEVSLLFECSYGVPLTPEPPWPPNSGVYAANALAGTV
ncbi:MAG: hypothetical protein NUW23_15840, partial [Firmicutes bacterium]|nr:hypothetical protein [Bacillota bacterium]